MIPILLIIIGGILVLISVVGFFLYIFEPIIKNYRIVIKREDDYTHYTSPKNYALLQNARKNYCMGLLVMFAVGFVLLYTGIYLRFGERGFGLFFSTEPVAQTQDIVSETLNDNVNADGDYVTEDGETYKHYIIVKAKDIYYKDQYIGDSNEFRSFISDKEFTTPVYIIDGYAAASTIHELIDIFKEYGFEYEPKTL